MKVWIEIHIHPKILHFNLGENLFCVLTCYESTFHSVVLVGAPVLIACWLLFVLILIFMRQNIISCATLYKDIGSKDYFVTSAQMCF